METNPGIVLQRMGVEVSPDDHRSAEEILNMINRRRIENNVAMEPGAAIRAQMAQYALRTYPIEADKGILSDND
jgi:hypothetical protein